MVSKRAVVLAAAVRRCGAAVLGFLCWIGLGSLQMAEADELQLDAMVYLWAPATDGKVSIGGNSFDVGADSSGGSSFWNDFFDADQIYGAFGLFGVGYGRWHGFANASWANVEYGRTLRGLGEVGLRIEETVAEAAVGYDVAAEPGLRVVPFLGARYAKAETHVSSDLLGNSSSDLDQLFPILGVSMRYDFAKDWWLTAAADAGAVSDDTTWSVYAAVGYRMNPFGVPMSLVLGYRALGLDVSQSSPNVGVDLIQHGFLLGLHFRVL